MDFTERTAPAARLATSVGATIAGVPWVVVLVLVLLQLAATAAWRVYQSPDLMPEFRRSEAHERAELWL